MTVLMLLLFGLAAGAAVLSHSAKSLGSVQAQVEADGPVSPFESPPIALVPLDVPSNLVPALTVASSFVTGGVAGGAIGIVETLLSNYEARKARIAAEGEWAGQIGVFLRGVSDELLLQTSVREMGNFIVENFGFGGSWRIGIDDPLQGMRFVLTAPMQPTANLRSINFHYQDSLRRAYGVSDSKTHFAAIMTAAGVTFNPIIFLKLEPHASEMKKIARGG